MKHCVGVILEKIKILSVDKSLRADYGTKLFNIANLKMHIKAWGTWQKLCSINFHLDLALVNGFFWYISPFGKGRAYFLISSVSFILNFPLSLMVAHG